MHHFPRVGEVVLVAAAEGQPVQGPDDGGVEGVVLSVLAKPEQPRIAEREGRRIAERPPVALQHVLRNLPEPDPAEARGRAGEGELDKGVVQPDGLEDLGAVVAADRGDAHLGHHLEEASLDHAAVPREGVRRLAPGPRRLRRDRLVHEVRIDGAGPVPDQRRDLVDVPRLSGLRHQAHPHPQAPADEFLVHRPHGQEHRDGRLPRIDGAVGEHEEYRPFLDVIDGFVTQADEPPLKPFAALGRREDHGQGARPKPRQHTEVRELRIRQERAPELNEAGVLGAFVEHVRAGPEERPERHDQPFPKRVDRGVGDLGEPLPDVGVEKARPGREDRERGVVAHGPDRLDAVLPHGREDALELFLRVSKRREPSPEGSVVARRVRDPGCGRRPLRADPAGRKPRGVRPRAGALPLDRLVREDAARRGVDRDHPPGAEPPLLDDPRRVQRDDAHLAGHDDEPVVRDRVPGRPKAVAVERRRGDPAVAEREGRGAVPRLGQARVKLIERPEVLRHLGDVLPGLGDEHHHRVEQVPAGMHDELQDVVERRAVAAAGPDHRQEIRHPLAPQGGPQVGLPGAHPVEVPPQRVDLAVVGEEAERLGEPPAREGVGAVPLVEHRQRGLEPRIHEVRVEPRELGGGEQAFVHDRVVRQRRHVRVLDLLLGPAPFDGAPDEVQEPFELDAPEPLRPADEDLLDLGPGPGGFGPEGGRGHRNLPPSEEPQPLPQDPRFDDRPRAGLLARLSGEKDHADAEVRVARDPGPQPLELGLEQPVGNLRQDPRPVAGLSIGRDRAAVGQVRNRLERALEDGVAAAGGRGHEPDAAAVVVEPWIDQPGHPAVDLPSHPRPPRNTKIPRERSSW